jgi:hypothetical protein
MKGVTRTRGGHLRYTSPKELRNKYVHRVTVEKLIEETPYSLRLLLPWPYEVHHLDYNGANNEPSNLLIADVRLHSAMTVDGMARRSGGQFIPKYRKPPEWAEAACADDAPDWVSEEAVGGNA